MTARKRFDRQSIRTADLPPLPPIEVDPSLFGVREPRGRTPAIENHALRGDDWWKLNTPGREGEMFHIGSCTNHNHLEESSSNQRCRIAHALQEFPHAFSNFGGPPIVVGGLSYPTREHYYQAMKADDPEDHEKIRRAFTPGRAKTLGRVVKIRPNWERIKFDVMLEAIRAACEASPQFATFLKEYRFPIVEWNTWHDRIWGVCLCSSCGRSGRNLLGHALQQVRLELNRMRPPSRLHDEYRMFLTIEEGRNPTPPTIPMYEE